MTDDLDTETGDAHLTEDEVKIANGICNLLDGQENGMVLLMAVAARTLCAICDTKQEALEQAQSQFVVLKENIECMWETCAEDREITRQANRRLS